MGFLKLWVISSSAVAAALSLARWGSFLPRGALPRDMDRVAGVEVLDTDLSRMDT